FLPIGIARQLTSLTHGHDAGTGNVGDSRSHQKAARFNASYDIEPTLKTPGKHYQRHPENLRVSEQGGDVVEEDAFLGVVLNLRAGSGDLLLKGQGRINGLNHAFSLADDLGAGRESTRRF